MAAVLMNCFREGRENGVESAVCRGGLEEWWVVRNVTLLFKFLFRNLLHCIIMDINAELHIVDN